MIHTEVHPAFTTAVPIKGEIILAMRGTFANAFVHVAELNDAKVLPAAMTEPSAIAGWTDFLVASAGAIGTLAGLVFVSLSINLARIIELRGVSGRAGETLLLLTGTLAGVLTMLVPHLTVREHGLILCATAVPTWLLPNLIQVRSIQTRTYYRAVHAVVRSVMHQAATLPGVFAGLSLCGLVPGGLDWFAVGVIMSMLVAMFNAWILLVEILR
jgi:hypothetical protein